MNTKFNEQNKSTMIVLLEMGMPNNLVSKYMGISVVTVQKHITLIKKEGWNGEVNTPVKAIPTMLLLLAKLRSNYSTSTEMSNKGLSRNNLISYLSEILQTEKIVSSLDLVCKSISSMFYPGFAKGVTDGYKVFLQVFFQPHNVDCSDGSFLWRNYLENLNSEKVIDTENWPSKIIQEISLEYADSVRDDVMRLFTLEHCKRAESQFFPSLTEREADVLKMFYGLGVPKLTLDEIAEKLDMARERIRQIKEKAVRRGRHNSRLDLILEDLPIAPVYSPTSENRIKIEDCDFSVRAFNCIKGGLGFTYLDEFSEFFKGDLIKFRNSGRKTAAEIEAVMAKYNLKFRE